MPVSQLPRDYEFFFYQNKVNHNINAVASHNVIAQHQQQHNIDCRAEAQTNPVQKLTDRTKDNTGIAH